MMILQRYVARELIQAFLLIFIILFAIVTLTGPFFEFHKEYQTIGAGFLADVLPYFIPQAVSYIIPIAILIAGVFVFGRLSEDNEIMVIRYSGVHLSKIIWPLILFGLALSILVIWLNVFVIPHTQSATSFLTINTIKNSIMSPSLINRTIKLPGGYQIYYNDIIGNSLKDVSVIQLDKNGDLYQHIKAQEGKLELSEETSQLTLTLQKVTEVTWEEKGKEPMVLPNSESLKSIVDLSGVLIPKRKNLSTMSQKELNKMIKNNDTSRFRLSEILVEKYRRYAISFAPLLFLLIGIPIGIIIRKGSKVAGLGISALIIFLGYYPLTIFGTYLGNINKITPQLAIWLPNGIILIIAIILTYTIFKK